jgi:hypothetical protein
MNKKTLSLIFLSCFSSIALAQGQPTDQNANEKTNITSKTDEVDVEKRSEEYIKAINKSKNLNITPFQLDKWKKILIEYHRVMSETDNEDHKAYYTRKYREAVNGVLREYQVEKMK